MANALVKEGREMPGPHAAAGLGGGAVQAALPESLVVGRLPPSAGVGAGEARHVAGADVLVCSDHADATADTMALIDSIEGLRPLDAGSLAQAAADRGVHRRAASRSTSATRCTPYAAGWRWGSAIGERRDGCGCYDTAAAGGRAFRARSGGHAVLVRDHAL